MPKMAAKIFHPMNLKSENPKSKIFFSISEFLEWIKMDFHPHNRIPNIFQFHGIILEIMAHVTRMQK